MKPIGNLKNEQAAQDQWVIIGRKEDTTRRLNKGHHYSVFK